MSQPFLDSNIVLYLLSGDAVKVDRAQALLEAGGVISVQVLNEGAKPAGRGLGTIFTPTAPSVPACQPTT